MRQSASFEYRTWLESAYKLKICSTAANGIEETIRFGKALLSKVPGRIWLNQYKNLPAPTHSLFVGR